MTLPSHHLIEVMGTMVTIDVHGFRGVEGDLAGAITQAAEVLHEADRIFSTYKPMSPLSQLRRGEITLGEAPADVAAVLDLCGHAKRLSLGFFDPWALPGGVDPTGYVKGWAAARALDELRDLPCTGVVINAGGDCAAWGTIDDGTPFVVGIVDPATPDTFLCAARLENALATSGTSERGNHLFDPSRKSFTTSVRQATVVGPDLGLTDALATALCVGADQLLPEIDNLPGYEGLVLGLDGRLRATPGFPFAL